MSEPLTPAQVAAEMAFGLVSPNSFPRMSEEADATPAVVDKKSLEARYKAREAYLMGKLLMAQDRGDTLEGLLEKTRQELEKEQKRCASLSKVAEELDGHVGLLFQLHDQAQQGICSSCSAPRTPGVALGESACSPGVALVESPFSPGVALFDSSGNFSSPGRDSGSYVSEEDIFSDQGQEDIAVQLEPEANKDLRRRSYEIVVTKRSVDANGNFQVTLPAVAADRVCKVLPVPKNFRVTRFHGDEDVSVAWDSLEDDRVACFKIYVDKEFHSIARSPTRTKALLNGIKRLMEPGALVVIEIRTVDQEGWVSPSASTLISVPRESAPAAIRMEDMKTRRETMSYFKFKK